MRHQGNALCQQECTHGSFRIESAIGKGSIIPVSCMIGSVPSFFASSTPSLNHAAEAHQETISFPAWAQGIDFHTYQRRRGRNKKPVILWESKRGCDGRNWGKGNTFVPRQESEREVAQGAIRLVINVSTACCHKGRSV
jgi:hypothetical protein